jgi:hypothetical protein
MVFHGLEATPVWEKNTKEKKKEKEKTTPATTVAA